MPAALLILLMGAASPTLVPSSRDGQPAVAAPARAAQAAEAPAPSPPIVVTGIRVQTYRDRLAQCLARNCPVNEDVDATMALAEVLFLEGQYEEARRAVRLSLGRNGDQAAAFPEPVSDLHRVYALLSSQLGFDRVALQSTHRILRSLEAGLPREDHRHFTARFEIVEEQLAQGRFLGAQRGLSELARRARAAGREDVAAMAELRQMWFDYAVFPYGSTKSRLIRMSQLTDPAQRIRMIGAKALLARIYQLEGDEERANALLAEVGRGNSTRRRLLHAPSYELLRQEVSQGFEVGASGFISVGEDGRTNARFLGASPSLTTGNMLNRLPENQRAMWIDIGFWVMPDGRVSGLEILRHGADPGWAEPLLASASGRRYSTAPEASYRVERYTYTSRLETVTGTRGTQHSPRARAEYFDLTDPNQPPPGPPPTAPAPPPRPRRG